MSRSGCAAVLTRLKLATGTSSDAALAKVLGVSPQTLSSWKVRNSVPYSFCIDLAVHEDVSLDWLLLGEGSQLRAASLPQPDPDDEWQARLFAQLRALSLSDLQAVALVVEDKQRIRYLEQRVVELSAQPGVRG
ncbi:MAG TPA: helix-turn-helix domain-containing protein [Pseudomonas sp.]|uniref:helix-turn-helix domain-containing protein n=1 Tax=Pseudomonas sp. TaxID=306 RepID=UPI002B48E0A1|nr:helix-turn-helix domain-containing protein [Pseudomonas sp.]HKS12378.1 helix-turn-helix domain-containing protein [Pseudomonas sp.]